MKEIIKFVAGEILSKLFDIPVQVIQNKSDGRKLNKEVKRILNHDWEILVKNNCDERTVDLISRLLFLEVFCYPNFFYFEELTEENEKFIWENIAMSYREKTGENLLIDKKIIFKCINYHNKELSKLLFNFKDIFTYKLINRDFEKLYVKCKRSKDFITLISSIETLFSKCKMKSDRFFEKLILYTVIFLPLCFFIINTLSITINNNDFLTKILISPVIAFVLLITILWCAIVGLMIKFENNRNDKVSRLYNEYIDTLNIMDEETLDEHFLIHKLKRIKRDLVYNVRHKYK